MRERIPDKQKNRGGRANANKKGPTVPIFCDTTGRITALQEMGVNAQVLTDTPMNKGETRYAEMLQEEFMRGQIEWWAFEPMKLHIGEGSWFTPDFGQMISDCTLDLIDYKGTRKNAAGDIVPYTEEAARVRIKTAATLFPFFRFYVAWEDASDPRRSPLRHKAIRPNPMGVSAITSNEEDE